MLSDGLARQNEIVHRSFQEFGMLLIFIDSQGGQSSIDIDPPPAPTLKAEACADRY